MRTGSSNPEKSVTRHAPDLPSRIPSLDGLRAFSIGLVIIAHTSLSIHWLRPFAEHLGNYGVRIFFVISGFLITGILLKEVDKTGRISLRNFYIRRSLRIFPAFYLYLTVIAILSGFGAITLLKGDLLHAATYTMNYYVDRSWWVNHTWSLSVEEQFYLLWPTVLVLAGRRRGLKLAAAMVLAAPLIRALMYFQFHAPTIAMGRHFEAVSDALACGCLLAAYYNRIGQSRLYNRFASSPSSFYLAIALLGLPALMYKIWLPLYYIVGQSIANIGALLLIDRSVRFPKSLSGITLNWAPFALIGTWSYSIYLWQEFFLSEPPGLLNWSRVFNILAVFVVSAASYYLVELNFLKLKNRFLVVEPSAPRRALVSASADSTD